MSFFIYAFNQTLHDVELLLQQCVINVYFLIVSILWSYKIVIPVLNVLTFKRFDNFCIHLSLSC